jgi:elongation factor Ts
MQRLPFQLLSGKTLGEAYVEATSTIGEKIAFRRFQLVEKTDDQNFGAYQHNGGRIGVITVIEGGDERFLKQLPCTLQR